MCPCAFHYLNGVQYPKSKPNFDQYYVTFYMFAKMQHKLNKKGEKGEVVAIQLSEERIALGLWVINKRSNAWRLLYDCFLFSQ